MKDKKIIKKIISLILFIIMLVLFVYFGTRNYEVIIPDNVKFAKDYNISKNNVFKYVKGEEVLNILNGEDGIIFMGFASNKWCEHYAKLLNEVAKTNNLKEIYYYDFKMDREINNTTYRSIISKLSSYLIKDDTGKMNLTAPSVLIVKNGKILYFDDEVSEIRGDITPDEYFTDYKNNLFIANINNILNEYNKGE